LRRRSALAVAAGFLLASLVAEAATLTGTVTNGTTNKASAGDEVVLIKLASGMEELGHTKTDSNGKFTFNLEDSGLHLVRAIHQGVTYHRPVPPGTNAVSVEVFDSSPKISGISAVADLMYIQAQKGQLGITRIFAVDNKSKPPRTQMNDSNFEFYVPEGADIEAATAQTAGGQPVNVSPTPQAEKGRYAFVFPLRPGQTQFQVSFRMAYAGKRMIDPRLIYPLEHFVAIMPRSITFKAAQSGVYEDKQPPDQPEAIAQVASNPKPGQKLAFEISGEGMLKEQNQDASNGEQGTTSATADNRPGGGLGPPIEAPDPLDKYRGYILGGFALVLVAGAFYMTNRSRSATPVPAPGNRSTTLLDGLKEELFELELERQRGQISDTEYQQAKTALDQTLARALKRSH